VTRVAVLTPAGTGAIATLAVVGAGAWHAVKANVRPASAKPLPDAPPLHRVWFGRLGEGAGDEVFVVVKQLDPLWVEVHCHGGRHVVRWVVEKFTHAGCVEVTWQELVKPTPHGGWALDPRALDVLTRAPTTRPASILLDQCRGAFVGAVKAALASLDDPDTAAATTILSHLVRYASVGRHLVNPWVVAVVGPPNVGKSSLVNALAGYQRAVVSDVPGTTRDVVRTLVALDGWPVEFVDTAGLREPGEELEAAGIERTRRVLQAADLALWVRDATDPSILRPDFPPPTFGTMLVANKIDIADAVTADIETYPVSALTGTGIIELVESIAGRLVPEAPPPGSAVPYTPVLVEQVEQAASALAVGNLGAARSALLRCLD